jgi:hypothetical protein
MSSSGVVVIAVLVSVLYCIVRKRNQRLASQKEDTKVAHEKVPSDEAALPLCHDQPSTYDPDEKLLGGMVKSEKPYSTPYDPVYPAQHYGHQFSDSASIASSVYNAPPVMPAQPQDYSVQHYYLRHPNTGV